MADLCMTKKEAASTVFGNPGILLSSVERSLQPKITWLANKLQMDETKVVDMIRRRDDDYVVGADGGPGNWEGGKAETVWRGNVFLR